MPIWRDEEVKRYHDEGYLLYKKPLFTVEEQAELTDLFEQHLAAKGAKRSDELDTPHFDDTRLLKFLLSDTVLDLVEPLIGPNIGLWSSHFISKEPFVGRATPWHEDSSYWKNRVSRYDQIITVWLAIDPSTCENGCMRVIPGSHKNGFSEYEAVDSSVNTFGSRIRNVNEDLAVDFELKPGECSLHDARIIHGAKPNVSPQRRCGYTMRYFSTETKIDPERNKNHKVWLARGRDVAGNRYANA